VRNDINTRADIDALMVRFYGRAMTDAVIGPLFTDVAQLDLAHHLPVIGDFWESTLFGSGVYSRHRRNPLLVHAELDAKARLAPHHFARWLELFTASVDESFAGTRAEYAKQRGRAIAQRMQEFLRG
jgi:hemoglobin